MRHRGSYKRRDGGQFVEISKERLAARQEKDEPGQTASPAADNAVVAEAPNAPDLAEPADPKRYPYSEILGWNRPSDTDSCG